MAKPRPITDEDREAVRRLHAEGKSRNAIARELGRGGRTISTIAAELNLSFNRAAATRVATEVRQADLAARRARLAEKLHEDAERLREQMWQPHTYFDWGGKEHDFDTYTAPEPIAADKRALMATAATAIDRSLKLAPPKDDDGSGEVGSLLTALFDRLRDRHGDG